MAFQLLLLNNLETKLFNIESFMYFPSFVFKILVVVLMEKPNLGK